jgi:hypothetical protein
MTSPAPSSHKRARNLTSDDLNTFDLGFTDVDKNRKYVDTPWTALEHPKGFSLQLGATVTYQTSTRSPIRHAILRGIVTPRNQPGQTIFFVQNWVSNDTLRHLGYAPSSLGMDDDRELAITNDYSFIPMSHATGNCMVLTFEQHKFILKPGHTVDQTFYYRCVCVACDALIFLMLHFLLSLIPFLVLGTW